MTRAQRPAEPPILPRWTVVVLAVVLLLVVAGGAWFYRSEEADARTRVREQLTAIATLKVDQIVTWRRGQLFDAASLTESAGMATGIARELAAPDPPTREAVLSRFRSVQRQHDYADVALLDEAGRVRFRLAQGPETFSGEQAVIEQARRTMRPAMSDLHMEPGHSAPHLSVVAPILSVKAPRVPIAFVVLVNDARRFLYPLIQSWPTPSRTAETLLVRRDGDDALFLNDVRHRPGAALALRVPLARANVPAAMALLGRTGVVEGIDYRGVLVVAELVPVPDSPWFMVAKIDADEIYADWRRRAVLLVLLIGGLSLSLVGAGMVVRQRLGAQHFQSLYRHEAALRASIERQSITLRSIGDAVIATDARGLVELMNPVAERLTGWTEAEAAGRPLAEVFRIVDETDRTTVQNPVDRVLRDGTVVALANHTLLIARDGTERPIADSAAPIRDQQSGILGVVLVFRDQTDERAKEQALRQSEALLLDSQEIAGMGSYVLDIPAGSWTSSAVLDTIFGIGPDDDRSVGGWVALIHPDDQAMMADYFTNEVVGRRTPFDKEYRIVRAADGQQRWVHGRGRLTFDADGHPLRMIGTIRDITVTKDGESERARLQAQLVQAQKMESVGRLAGGVAHDFNNMLGAILGYTEMALDRAELPESVRADLLEVQKAGLRSATLTRQLLAFARRQTIAPRVIDLNSTVEGLLNMLRRLIGEDVDLAWRPGALLWPVMMDPGQVNQILVNLCVNARDAIAGVGRITIETGHAAIDDAYCAAHAGFLPGEYVRLVVSDDGAGMEQAVLDHLFEPFFTTKRQGEGTGLGLATVYGIVKQNNGFINVYSEPGQGSAFSIYFPRHAGAGAMAEAPAPPGVIVRGHETVLLVEDELSLLRATGMALINLGYEVLAAPTPAEALRIAEEHPGVIDVLLTDVVMPGMNGRELAERLRARRPGLACVYMSGYTADVIANRGVLEEGVLFIQKPFPIAALAAKLREALTPAS